MNDQEILKILEKFNDYLEAGNILSYCLRWLGWFFIKGSAWLVDGLENITDSVLGLKTFFASEGVQEFVQTIQPFLYVLLAFSFLYVGYMLILNKKINREQIATNVFISIAVILLLNTGMTQADKFTDEAIRAVNISEQGDESSVSEKIIKDHLTDIPLFDEDNWKSIELSELNKIPQENILDIDITQQIDEDFKMAGDKDISEIGKKVLSNKMTMDNHGNKGIEELKNGWFDFFPEKYYRWHWDFWTIAISLFVTGMTLLFIAIKLAKLCYELAFNYILANIVAPANIANGQMLKQVLQRIFNSFMVIIMIFISMKVYLAGTVFISEQLNGVAYLIALIAISIAVVDGPIMCERLFGIDAGLKSGWHAVAGGYALSKSVSGVAGTFGKKDGKILSSSGAGTLLASADTTGLRGSNNEKYSSLHDEMKSDEPKGKKQNEKSGQETQSGIPTSPSQELEKKRNQDGNESVNANPVPMSESVLKSLITTV